MSSTSPDSPTAAVPYAPDEILIKFREDATTTEQDTIRFQFQATRLHSFASGAQHWRLGPNEEVLQAISDAAANSLIEYAEPNFSIEPYLVPIDPNFAQQWALRNVAADPACTNDADIDAELAWDITTGSSSVVVAVTDTGMAYTHDELAPNVWVNPLEVVNNSIDEDGCGYLNDYNGYDFVTPDSDPYEGAAAHHGTAVSGIIGSKGNVLNTCGECGACPEGVAGVSWNPRLMPLRIIPGDSEQAFVSQAVLAIDYATCMRVDVINASWGGLQYSQTLRDAIQRAGEREITFVAAAGNTHTNLDDSADPNTLDKYPARYDLSNIITVTSTTCADVKGGTAWGPISVDLGAPGRDIMVPGGPKTILCDLEPLQTWNYISNFSGSSAAAPHVSGVAALIRGLSPKIPVELLKKRILENVDPLSDLAQGGPYPTVSGGRLNAHKAIQNQDTVAPGPIVDLYASDSTTTTMRLTWTATADDGYESGVAALYQVRYSTATITDANFYLAKRAGNEPVPGLPGSFQTMTVTGLSSGTTYNFAIKAFDEWGNGPLSNVSTCSTQPTMCTISFCTPWGDDMFKRCTFNLGHGTCGCCSYTCVVDSSCTQPDPCPTWACADACN